MVYGSPNYLMATYGLGYSFALTIDTELTTKENAKELITKKLPSAQFIDEREKQGEDKLWHLNYKVLNVKGGRTL